MSYVSEIFERTNLQKITEFIMNGGECSVTDKNYKERVDEVEEEMERIIKENFPGKKEYEKIMNSILLYVYESKDIHMEIGLQCGLFLGVQILKNYLNNK